MFFLRSVLCLFSLTDVMCVHASVLHILNDNCSHLSFSYWPFLLSSNVMFHYGFNLHLDKKSVMLSIILYICLSFLLLFEKSEYIFSSVCVFADKLIEIYQIINNMFPFYI